MGVFEIERKSPGAGQPRARARSFSEAQILDAIRDWAVAYGESPRWLDWDPAAARRKGEAWRAERFAAGEWPSMRVVRRAFPTLTAAVEAAGLTPRRPGSRKRNTTGRDAVLDALREWTRRFGEPPRQADLDPFRARRTNQPWRVERYETGDWPTLNTVRRHFGTLTAAVEAAGLQVTPLAETVEARGARRRRNRLALVQYRMDRASGTPGSVADAVRAVSEARAGRDVDELDGALLQLASESLRWAERLHAPTASEYRGESPSGADRGQGAEARTV